MLQVREHQMLQLSSARASSLIAGYRRSVDAVSKGSHAPSARLQALAEEIVKSLDAHGALAPLLAVEIRYTAGWLMEALSAGVTYRELRAAALLNAAAALGACWFMDDRLITSDDALAAHETPAENIAVLFAAPQADRFRFAAGQEREIREGVQFALRPALRAELTAASLQPVITAAFPAADGDEEALEAAAPGFRSRSQQRADRFISRERVMLADAQISSARLAVLCVAGDLALGLGRCVRLLSVCEADDEAARVVWLRRTIHDLAGLAE